MLEQSEIPELNFERRSVLFYSDLTAALPTLPVRQASYPSCAPDNAKMLHIARKEVSEKYGMVSQVECRHLICLFASSSNRSTWYWALRRL